MAVTHKSFQAEAGPSEMRLSGKQEITRGALVLGEMDASVDQDLPNSFLLLHLRSPAVFGI